MKVTHIVLLATSLAMVVGGVLLLLQEGNGPLAPYDPLADKVAFQPNGGFSIHGGITADDWNLLWARVNARPVNPFIGWRVNATYQRPTMSWVYFAPDVPRYAGPVPDRDAGAKLVQRIARGLEAMRLRCWVLVLGIALAETRRSPLRRPLAT